jgi:hypothetical protein
MLDFLVLADGAKTGFGWLLDMHKVTISVPRSGNFPERLGTIK